MPIPLPDSTAPLRSTRPVRARSIPWTQPLAELGRARWSEVRKERLFREMHLLVLSGVEPRMMLDLLVEAQSDERLSRTLGEVRDAVLAGVPLSQAMATAKVFDDHEQQTVRIGEESGRLADVLLQLADHHADRIALRRTVRQAFAYPVFILVITLVVVLFMMNVVVPMFAEVFARSGADLPPLTAAVLKASNVFRSAWPFLLGVVALVPLLWSQVREREPVRRFVEASVRRVPVLGTLTRKAALARFCRSMAFLLQAGTPLDRALRLSEGMGGTVRSRAAVADIRTRVVTGSSLRQAMAAHTDFDREMVAMIGVAEEVKQLDRMFLRLSERYAADVKHQATLLGSVLEPLTIVVIAVLVGTVLVAMYLPMFKLSTAM